MIQKALPIKAFFVASYTPGIRTFISSNGSTRRSYPPPPTPEYLETFLVVMSWECCWHLMVRGQRCSPFCSAQDSPHKEELCGHKEELPGYKVSSTEVEKSCFTGSVLGGL